MYGKLMDDIFDRGDMPCHVNPFFCILDIVYSFGFYLRLHLHYNRFFGSVAYTSSQTAPNCNKMPLLLELNVHVYTIYM